jgi:adenylyltransferase/sulfurtransferase
MEAIKVLAGFGEPLAGRLLVFDLRNPNFETLPLRRRVDCEVCGKVGDGAGHP